MALAINSSYPFTLTAVDGTTTTAYQGFTNTDLNSFGSFTLNIPSGLTITLSVTFDTTADANSTWVQIETGLTNKIFNYADSGVTGIKIARTAGSGTVKGVAYGLGGGGGGGSAANPSEVEGVVAHDAVGTSVNPLLIGGYASAAAPTDVSADGDATRAWVLRNGAQATVITAAGALVGGDATNGLDVDVTRMSALVAGSAIVGQVGIDQTTPGTTNAVSPISGQAGVQGGSGTTNALTQRVTLATDVALPAGTNAIGKLAANSGVDIGDVDITSVVPGTTATSLGKAEDDAHTSGDTGVAVWAVRKDTAASTAADGDYHPVEVDSSGRVWTHPVPSYSFGRMSTNTTTTHKSGAGVLHSVIINTVGAAANTCTIYDNTAASGTVIAVIDTTSTGLGVNRIYDVAFATGLTAITATGTPADITFTYL